MNTLAPYYDMIFRRKSFHLFRGVGDGRITEEELELIEDAFRGFDRLFPEIATGMRIVPAEKVNFKRDAEYCLLLYSEKKEGYLANIGYLGGQLDLWLVSRGIGTLWFGIGKPDEKCCDGLEFVIMLAVHKVNDEGKFRGDLFKAKRRPVDEVWDGEVLPGISDLARYAPSACNSQPWRVVNRGGMLTVSRFHRSGRVGIMSPSSASYFNRIDLGIYLCFLEICMEHEGIAFERTLFPDDGGERELTKNAEYRLEGEKG